jgi:ribonuclease E
MSEAETGQPVEVSAESPRTPSATPGTNNDDKQAASERTGTAESANSGGGASGDRPVGTREPGAGDGAARRRRGSRGGRGRSRPAGSGPATEGEGTSDGEGQTKAPASGVVAGAANGTSGSAPGPTAERPKIGDSRPARPTGTTTPEVTNGDVGSSPGGDSTASVDRARPSAQRTQQKPAGSPDGNKSAVGAKGSLPTGRPAPAATPRGDVKPRPEGRRGGRERRGKAVGRYMICVHVRPEMTQIALLEGRTLVEHYISRASDDATQIDGNIYRGRVQNVLPGMEAAFIDIGTPKNAVLYHGDVRYDTDDVESPSGSGQPRIEQLLRPGQTILCQVTKNPIGAKGARLTQEVSLPGRFVVLVPNSTAYGISKRLDDAERKRLRRIVDAIRPQGHGLIVRTAAAGASAEELGNDVERLVSQWESIAAESTKGQGAALLYREPAIAVRVIREELNREYRGVVIDDRALYEQVRDYVGAVNPELADRVEYFDPDVESLPVFERYHIHEQLHKALDRKVFLPSGGSLVIDRTEALTVIDVNTGKNVGTTNLEETVYRNNLEAAEEVARQLRLRDIGGIIVIDFIDMEIRENRDKVGAALRSALARDKTRTQVFDISELGLVEMTRKRVSEGLIESMSTTCEVCGGRGIVFDDPEL